MVLLRHDEAVELRAAGVVLVAMALLQRLGVFLVIDVADALEEEQREDELLVVAGINVPAEVDRRAPEVFFEGLLVH